MRAVLPLVYLFGFGGGDDVGLLATGFCDLSVTTRESDFGALVWVGFEGSFAMHSISLAWGVEVSPVQRHGAVAILAPALRPADACLSTGPV